MTGKRNRMHNRLDVLKHFRLTTALAIDAVKCEAVAALRSAEADCVTRQGREAAAVQLFSGLWTKPGDDPAAAHEAR